MAIDNFMMFHRQEANEPTQARAAWALSHLRQAKVLSDPKINAVQLIRETFRTDVYRRASQLADQDKRANPEAICA